MAQLFSVKKCVQRLLGHDSAIRSTMRIQALKTNCKDIEPKENKITKSVFISQSNDIFTNLALEDWIFKNMDLKKQNAMLVWKNNPCVVIGKFQNPWQETNPNYLNRENIPLVRRNSGGGCVYHDLGNLNISFITSRSHYDRKYNLEIIKRALYRGYGIKVEINSRLDLTVGNSFKISGTASKLGREAAYHHCTLLVSTNKQNLKDALSRRLIGIESNATESVPSPVVNLQELNNKVSMDFLPELIGNEYLRTEAMSLRDGGEVLKSQQKGFQLVNPTDEWFPGLKAISEDLQQWEWRFGKTPPFTVSRAFPVPDNLLSKSNYASPQELIIKMSVEAGLINDVTLVIPPGMMDCGFYGTASVVTCLKGKRFTPEVMSHLQHTMLDKNSQAPLEREMFVAKCFTQVVNSV